MGIIPRERKVDCDSVERQYTKKFARRGDAITRVKSVRSVNRPTRASCRGDIESGAFELDRDELKAGQAACCVPEARLDGARGLPLCSSHRRPPEARGFMIIGVVKSGEASIRLKVQNMDNQSSTPIGRKVAVQTLIAGIIAAVLLRVYIVFWIRLATGAVVAPFLLLLGVAGHGRHCDQCCAEEARRISCIFCPLGQGCRIRMLVPTVASRILDYTQLISQ